MITTTGDTKQDRGSDTSSPVGHWPKPILPWGGSSRGAGPECGPRPKSIPVRATQGAEARHFAYKKGRPVGGLFLY